MPTLTAPPTGTVTFLFTDIEGSTLLWETAPDAMRPALARHDELLRQSLQDNSGYVFKTVGDAFCAAFPTANQALEAALAAQLALIAEAWGLPTALAVRMALHTGATEERGGDYFGPPLNRVARLMAAGHGGQILLSDVTQGLVRDSLPRNAALQDLGERRLKDLGWPEQVFQLRHPSLPADFPPLRSLDNPNLPNNLPQQTTSFIGRETQVEEVKALLAKTRLLTLTGAGGSGKTRLSLQVAADLLDGKGDGVWLVELAALTDPTLVAQAVADVLRVKEETGKPIQTTLVEALKTKRLLIVLDNCEHLITACASLADHLLRNCPLVHLLASSREPLNVAGEQTYRVPTLSLPDPKKPQTVEGLSQYEAVRLFIERAQAVQPSFAVTNANAPAVAQVCWRLDGIPLAIELAAARVRSLSVDEINTRLDHRFRLLTGGARNTLPRQQTLRALIDWSYNLLTEAEQALLRRLSVFVGGWTVEGAEIVCSGEPVEDWEVLDLLTALVDKSLAVAEPVGDGTRYRLLETVRQYAGEHLGERGETESARNGHLSWCVALAEEAVPHTSDSDQRLWLTRMETEYDNLSAGLAWADASSGAAGLGLRLAGTLGRFWAMRGYRSVGLKHLTAALSWDSAASGTQERARALMYLGEMVIVEGHVALATSYTEEALAIYRERGDRGGDAGSLYSLGNVKAKQGDWEAAVSLYEQALAIYREIGDRNGEASALGALGNVKYDQGVSDAARSLLEQALMIHCEIGNREGEAWTLHCLANVKWMQGDREAATLHREQALALFRTQGNRSLEAYTLSFLGNEKERQGDWEAATSLYEQVLAIYREIGDRNGEAWNLHTQASAKGGQGDWDAARSLLEQALAICREIGSRDGEAWNLHSLGWVAREQGSLREARGLLAQSLTLRVQLGVPRGILEPLEEFVALALAEGALTRAGRLAGASAAMRAYISTPMSPEQQAKHEGMLSSVRAASGEDAFAAAWDAGQAMTLEQAVEYALSVE